MSNDYTPGYIKLCRQEELEKRAEILYEHLSCCTLCPFCCKADRRKGEKGICQAPAELYLSKAVLHQGEEPPVSGESGSGTIFFTHCNLNCCFCQNYQISQNGLGSGKTPRELADIMLSLQAEKAHNINLVSGTHFLPHIFQALQIAAQEGLCLPLVYNTNGYESLETLKLLDGIIDIYIPDAKYSDDNLALKYSRAKNYSSINLDAIAEMHRQTGELVLDSYNIAQKGLIVRHLVLPENIAGTEEVFNKIKARIGTNIHISLMAQYSPCFRADRFQEINRKTTKAEYEQTAVILEELGFENGWVQDWENIDKTFLPDFTKVQTWN